MGQQNANQRNRRIAQGVSNTLFYMPIFQFMCGRNTRFKNMRCGRARVSIATKSCYKGHVPEYLQLQTSMKIKKNLSKKCKLGRKLVQIKSSHNLMQRLNPLKKIRGQIDWDNDWGNPHCYDIFFLGKYPSTR